MWWVYLQPRNFEKFIRADTIYLGPRTKVGVAEMQLSFDPDTGEFLVRGIKIQDSEWPVLPSMYPAWIGKGVFNYFSDRTVGEVLKRLGVEENPIRVEFVTGYGNEQETANLLTDRSMTRRRKEMTVPAAIPGLAPHKREGSLPGDYTRMGFDDFQLRDYGDPLARIYRKASLKQYSN
jgi:hypothetical protein